MIQKFLMVILISLGFAILAKSEEVLFHLSFDDTLKATSSQGQPDPTKAENINFGPGVKGQAAEIGMKSLLEYATAKNLKQERGTVMFWFKANWSNHGLSRNMDTKEWHCLFSEPDVKPRSGSGHLRFWFWGPALRADVSDIEDSYQTSVFDVSPGIWNHLAFTWDGSRKTIFINGVAHNHQRDKYSPLKLKEKPADDASLKKIFKSFFIGSKSGKCQADGFFDEFKIYDGPLTQKRILTEISQIRPFKLECDNIFFNSNETATLKCQLRNISSQKMTGKLSWKIRSSKGELIKEKAGIPFDITPEKTIELLCPLPSLAAGGYQLSVSSSNFPVPSQLTFWVLGENKWTQKGGELKTKLVKTVDFAEKLPENRFSKVVDLKKGELEGRTYLETGPGYNDRFAIKLTLPEAFRPYLIEIDYPDDKLRTMDIIVQNCVQGGSNYQLQSGVLCGDEYPNSRKMRTLRCLYWARQRDVAFIFMTTKLEAPAAVAELRVYQVDGALPDADVKAAKPVAGWTRSVGVYYEDPAIQYDFGLRNGIMPSWEETIDRLAAYMKWSGQNMFLYPGIWYNGKIGRTYNPRNHEFNFIDVIVQKFGRQDLLFMPTINTHNIDLAAKWSISEESFKNGSLHDSPVMIQHTGEPNPGGWHGTPPNFNPLHPETQVFFERHIDEFLDRYGEKPAFKGIVFHLTKHTTPWFGNLEAGYNDYNIQQFEKETGIKLPVDRKDPTRGKQYYEWLMANAKEKWIDWRCEQMSLWFKKLADQISSRRSDLKLGLFTYGPNVSELSDPRYTSSGYTRQINREAGLDSKFFQNVDNIIIGQTLFPADYRWSVGRRFQTKTPKAWASQRDRHFKKDTYAVIEQAKFSWINMHDRYWENSVGRGGKLNKPWLKETGWRVSTLNPPIPYAMEHYILPLKHSDVLGFSKGGFLIGTHGMEPALAKFAKAFLALPAVKFDDLPTCPKDVKVRQYRKDGETWFYAINTSRSPRTISVNFEKPLKSAFDLGRQAGIDVNGTAFQIKLDPYELRSFKISDNQVIGVKEE